MVKHILTVSIEGKILNKIEELRQTEFYKASRSVVVEELLKIGLQHLYEHLKEKKRREISIVKP